MTQEGYLHPAIGDVGLHDVLHALSDPLRLSIVTALWDGRARGWSEFDGRVAASTLSHHMKVLRMAGLIHNRRDGTRCQVSLRPEIDERFPELLATVIRLGPKPQGTKELEMTSDEFEAALREEGYTEVATRSLAPSHVTQPHAHDFDVRALVIDGEITLTVDGEAIRYDQGKIFTMQNGCQHVERVGERGATILSGRRYAASSI